MTLKMGEADHDIGIHERLTDLGLMHVLAALDRDERLVGALEAIGDDDLATRGIRGKAVLVGGVDVLERVFAATDVERVAVGEEGLAAQLLDVVADLACPVRAQEGEVARLTEVDLDGDELAVEVDGLKARGFHKAAQLDEQTLPVSSHIGKIYFGLCHVRYSSQESFVQY